MYSLDEALNELFEIQEGKGAIKRGGLYENQNNVPAGGNERCDGCRSHDEVAFRKCKRAGDDQRSIPAYLFDKCK